MRDIRSRLVRLEQNNRRHQLTVVIVHLGETKAQALARANLHPDQPVVIVDRSCQHVNPYRPTTI